MATVTRWLHEYFDPPALLFFLALSIYVLAVDIPTLRRKRLPREAKVFTVIGWASITIYFLFLLVMIFS